MGVLFDRQVELIIGTPPPSNNFAQQLPTAMRITDLRVSFKVERSDKPEPNKSEIRVFNLSANSRSQLQGKGIRTILNAGYPSTIAQIFSGEARNIDHVKQGVDWATVLQLGDGERAYQFSRVSRAFQPGTNLVDLVKHCITALQQDPGNVVDQLNANGGGLIEYSQGYTMHGQTSAEMTRLLDQVNLDWSIQDGRLQALPRNQALPGTGPLLSVDSGLVGSPALGTPDTKGGPAYLKVKALLQPQLRPGSRFQLKSLNHNGNFRCHKVIHTGDTFGGDWYTEIEASPLT